MKNLQEKVTLLKEAGTLSKFSICLQKAAQHNFTKPVTTQHSRLEEYKNTLKPPTSLSKNYKPATRINLYKNKSVILMNETQTIQTRQKFEDETFPLVNIINATKDIIVKKVQEVVSQDSIDDV